MNRIGLRVQLNQVPEMADVGYDYLELPLAPITALSDGEFLQLREYLERVRVRAEVLWDMLPEDAVILGDKVFAGAQHEWLDRACARAAALGAGVVCFDCAAQRRIPAGFDPGQARRQLGNFLRICQGHAAVTGLRVAVANCRRTEADLIHTLSEAAWIVSLLQLDRLGVLADTAAMGYASEPFEALIGLGRSLAHVHVSSAIARALPAPGDGEDYHRLFAALKRAAYPGGVTACQETPFTRREAVESLRLLRACEQRR